jgi:hypothetical protein
VQAGGGLGYDPFQCIIAPVQRAGRVATLRLGSIVKPDLDVALRVSPLGLGLPKGCAPVQTVLEKSAEVFLLLVTDQCCAAKELPIRG